MTARCMSSGKMKSAFSGLRVVFALLHAFSFFSPCETLMRWKSCFFVESLFDFYIEIREEQVSVSNNLLRLSFYCCLSCKLQLHSICTLLWCSCCNNNFWGKSSSHIVKRHPIRTETWANVVSTQGSARCHDEIGESKSNRWYSLWKAAKLHNTEKHQLQISRWFGGVCSLLQWEFHSVFEINWTFTNHRPSFGFSFQLMSFSFLFS